MRTNWDLLDETFAERDAYAAAYTYAVAFLEHRIDQQVEVNAEQLLRLMKEQYRAILKGRGVELPHESSPPAG